MQPARFCSAQIGALQEGAHRALVATRYRTNSVFPTNRQQKYWDHGRSIAISTITQPILPARSSGYSGTKPGGRDFALDEQIDRPGNVISHHGTPTAPAPSSWRGFEPNGPIVMVRNPDWWGFERYPHNVDRIELTPIANSEQRLAALFRGNLDLLMDRRSPRLIKSRARRG